MDKSSEVYNLFEFGELDDIFIPVRNTARVKYTCFDVSKHFIVVGANSGSLYVFSRSPLRYLQSFSNKEGALTHLRIDPNERYLAFATNKGIAALLEHNVRAHGFNSAHVGRLNTHTIPPRCLQVSPEHRGKTISCLQWDEYGTRLFIADTSGKVTSLNVSSKKAKTLFQSPTSLIVKLASQPVQMDFSQDKLLISTLIGCYLCDTAKEQYSHIGTKPRTGDFGACFYNNLYTQTPTIYAARPGSRLWEVDYEGSVLCTHQFKKALAKPPISIVSVSEDYPLLGFHEFTSSSFNFPKLLVVSGRFILTWVKERVFIFDPGSVSVLLWTIFSNEILDIRPYNNDLYIWGSDGKFHNYQLLSVEQGISMLLANSFWELSAKLCCFYESVVISAHSRNSLPKKSLENLLFHLQERNDCALNGEIRDLICRLNEPEKEPYANQNGDCNEVVYPVESGIYVVNRPSDNPLENPPPRMCSNGSVFQSKPFMNGNIKRQVTTNNDSAVETKDIRASLKNAQLTLLPTTKSQDACTTSSLSRISKTSSAVDLKSIKEKPNSNYKISFDDMLYEYDTPLPLLMSVAGGVFWDNDPVDVFPSMALLNPSAAFDELKNSLSSKYQSGKEHILCKIGLLEDRIKSRAVDDSTELLDVKQSAVTSSNHKSAEDSVSSNLKYSPVVKINLLPLYDVTKVTWEVINNPALKDKLLEVLENWVNCLIATQELTYCELHTQQVKMRNSPNVNTHTSDISKSMFCSTLARSVSTASSTELNHDGKCAQDSKEQTSCTLTNGYRRQSCPNLINVEDNSCYTIHEKNHLSNCIMNEHSTYVQFEDILWWQEVELLNDNCLLRVKKENGYPCVLCYPIAFITDHWGSDAFLHKLMRNIALMCFQTKTFGRITDFCKYFACFSRIENLQTDVLSSDAQCSSESETEKMNFILDHARSVFVRQFFHLFEPKNILQELHNDTTITFKTWKAILMGVLQLEEFDSELRQSYHDLSIFSSLTDALRAKPENYPSIIKSLLSAADVISARDILYLDQVISHLERSLFMTYMDAVFSNTKFSGSTRRYLQPTLYYGTHCSKICEDSVVHIAWLKCLLKAGLSPSFQDVKCSCGTPRPWSHLHPWKRKDLILYVFHLNPANQTMAFELFKAYGFWIGYLQICHKFVSRQEIFSILVQLHDLDILTDPFNIFLLPKTVSEWEQFIQLVVKHNKLGLGSCLVCNTKFDYRSDLTGVVKQNSLSLESTIFLMLKYCSVDAVLKLLTDIIDAHSEIKISSSFYQRVIATAIRRKRFESLSPWHSNKACAAPQIWAQLLMGSKNSFEEGQPFQVSTYNSSFTNPHCHWGITFEPSSPCNVCCLPLMVSLSNSSQGAIRIFPCGHGFHFQCITEEKCSICK